MVVETDGIMKPGLELRVGDNCLYHLDVAARMPSQRVEGVLELRSIEQDVERVFGSDITIVSISMITLYSSHELFQVLAISYEPLHVIVSVSSRRNYHALARGYRSCWVSWFTGYPTKTLPTPTFLPLLLRLVHRVNHVRRHGAKRPVLLLLVLNGCAVARATHAVAPQVGRAANCSTTKEDSHVITGMGANSTMGELTDA